MKALTEFRVSSFGWKLHELRSKNAQSLGFKINFLCKVREHFIMPIYNNNLIYDREVTLNTKDEFYGM